MLQQLKTAPNQLTLLRLIFIPFIAMAVMDGHFGWALGLFICAGLSDGLDGYLARRMNQRTTLGQYLDPIADKPVAGMKKWLSNPLTPNTEGI